MSLLIKITLFLLSASCLILFGGCSSISKGIVQGLISDDPEQEDTRKREIQGPRISGISDHFTAANSANIKRSHVLMVHGIGTPSPGYSTRLSENLVRALGLTSIDSEIKKITITSSKFPDQTLGLIQIKRFFNKDKTKEMLFYELNYSEILQEKKKELEFDTSGSYSFKRANINQGMKSFFNSTIPDAFIYLGAEREKVLVSVGQSLCWMTSMNWDELQTEISQECEPNTSEFLADEGAHYTFITHSLGSRITMDSWQRITELVLNPENDESNTLNEQQKTRVQSLKINLFMLANQLPLLQLSHEAPEIVGQEAAYCSADGEKNEHRLIRELSVVAFSDPNDIFSYAIPPDYSKKYIDSRLCANTSNIIINVAKTINLFDVGEIANPLTAHSDYDNDERVIQLIANGLGTLTMSDEVKNRCEWLQTQ